MQTKSLPSSKADPIDHLVFTAGDALYLAKLAELDLAKAREVMELRFWGVLTALKHGVGRIEPRGSILLTSGIAAERPGSGWSLVAGSLGAIEAMVRALAVELAPVRVNAVSPGLIRTNLWQDMSEHDREGMYEATSKLLPVGHIAEADDVAAAYVFFDEEPIRHRADIHRGWGACLGIAAYVRCPIQNTGSTSIVDISC